MITNLKHAHGTLTLLRKTFRESLKPQMLAQCCALQFRQVIKKVNPANYVAAH